MDESLSGLPRLQSVRRQVRKVGSLSDQGPPRDDLASDKLDDEDPLLLDPYNDNPDDHLVFDPDTGFIAGKTEKGRMTIKILGLDREELAGMRKRIAEHAGDTYTKFLEAVRTGHEQERVKKKEAVEKYKSGEEPYTAFARAAIARNKKIMEEALAEL